jgi:RNA polymerase sigma-70 factor (ECF subfamily)
MKNEELDILMLKIKLGNKQAFRKIFQHFYIDLCLFIDKILFDIDLSKDIAQDTFVKLWDNRHKIEECRDLKNYLWTMAKNRALDSIRKSNLKFLYQSYTINNQQIIYNQTEEIEVKELESKLIKVIQNFPEKTKEVYKLKIEKNTKIKEIAKTLSISEQSVSWHLAKAKAELKKVIKKYHSC